MSADNWAICPSCTEQFPMSPVEECRTFREDYEFWLDGKTKTVKVHYEGRCTVCGSGIKFSDDRPIEVRRLNAEAVR